MGYIVSLEGSSAIVELGNAVVLRTATQNDLQLSHTGSISVALHASHRSDDGEHNPRPKMTSDDVVTLGSVC